MNEIVMPIQREKQYDEYRSVFQHETSMRANPDRSFFDSRSLNMLLVPGTLHVVNVATCASLIPRYTNIFGWVLRDYCLLSGS